jgi:hypothetical protein
MSFFQPQVGLPLGSVTGTQACGVPAWFIQSNELKTIENPKSLPRPGTETIGIEKFELRFWRFAVSNPAD